MIVHRTFFGRIGYTLTLIGLGPHAMPTSRGDNATVLPSLVGLGNLTHIEVFDIIAR